MRVGLIGIGQAGGRIADLFTNFSKHTVYGKVIPFSLAINAAKSDLIGLSTIPHDERILIGQTEVRGHGVGMSRATGAAVAKSGLHTMLDAINRRLRDYVDAFMVIVGTGGGTGSGGAPTLVKELKANFREPVYVLAVLPSDEEGALMASNSVECISELREHADGILVFDNNIWKRQASSLEDAYYNMNSWLLRPTFSLLGAGEAKKDKVGVKVVDAGDIMASWQGLSILGYSFSKAKDFGDKIRAIFHRRDSIDMLGPTVNLYTVASKALAAGALSARCIPKEAQKGLLLFVGPRSEINIEGYTRARQMLEEAIGRHEVRGGDFPIDRLGDLRAVVLLSGFNDLPRLREFRERVAQAKIEDKQAEQAELA